MGAFSTSGGSELAHYYLGGWVRVCMLGATASGVWAFAFAVGRSVLASGWFVVWCGICDASGVGVLMSWAVHVTHGV